MNEEYYAVPSSVPVDESFHSDLHPFCNDMTCPCHEDDEAIGDLGQQVDDGLMTASEADRYYRGRAF